MGNFCDKMYFKQSRSNFPSEVSIYSYGWKVSDMQKSELDEKLDKGPKLQKLIVTSPLNKLEWLGSSQDEIPITTANSEEVKFDFRIKAEVDYDAQEASELRQASPLCTFNQKAFPAFRHQQRVLDDMNIQRAIAYEAIKAKDQLKIIPKCLG